MKLLTLLSFLSVVGGIVAAAPWESDHRGRECLCQNDAQDILNRYIAFLAHSPNLAATNATGQALFAENYVVISDSIAYFNGAPLGVPVYTDKQKYISDGLAAPPILITPSTTLGLYVVDCHKFIWHFNFADIASGQYEVRGFNLFNITASKQISQNDLEFNSVVWALDTGFKVTPPAS